MQNTVLKHKINLKIILLSLLGIFLIIGCITGCGMFKKNSNQQQNPEGQTDKIPKQLQNIESNIEKIFLTLGGPSLGAKEEKSDQTTDKDSSKSQESQGQGEEKQQESQGQQEQNEQKGSEGQKPEQGEEPGTSKKQAGEQDPWQQITQQIKNLHFSWNEYLPEAIKKGAKKEVIDGFSEALNKLTKITEDKGAVKSLLTANQLYSYVPDLYSLYKTKTSPEFKRLGYYARNSILTARSSDWTKASSDIEELKSTWALVKNTIDKKQQEDSAKLDLSIYELDKVVKEKNKNLTEIKGEITLTNIEALQKSMEKEGGNQ